MTAPQVLIPWDRNEAISIDEAAFAAKKSPSTIRQWCRDRHIGRRVAGGPWIISKIALQMLLDGNNAALRAYLSGDRSSTLVIEYFERAELGQLIRAWSRDTAQVRYDFGLHTKD